MNSPTIRSRRPGGAWRWGWLAVLLGPLLPLPPGSGGRPAAGEEATHQPAPDLVHAVTATGEDGPRTYVLYRQSFPSPPPPLITTKPPSMRHRGYTQAWYVLEAAPGDPGRGRLAWLQYVPALPRVELPGHGLQLDLRGDPYRGGAVVLGLDSQPGGQTLTLWRVRPRGPVVAASGLWTSSVPRDDWPKPDDPLSSLPVTGPAVRDAQVVPWVDRLLILARVIDPPGEACYAYVLAGSSWLNGPTLPEVLLKRP